MIMTRQRFLRLALGGEVHTDSFLHLKIKGDIIARIFSSLSHRSVRVYSAYENHENRRQP